MPNFEDAVEAMLRSDSMPLDVEHGNEKDRHDSLKVRIE